MPNETDYKLKFQITADAKSAQAELKNLDANIKKLSGGSTVQLQKGFKGAASELSSLVGIFTGNRLSGATSQITSFSTAVGAIPGPVGLAAGAIAGMGVAAVTAGTALFELTKKSAESVKAIGSFSTMTGIGVEKVSALRYALNFMHKDLSDVQPSFIFFAKTMDDAARGSDKAAAALKRVGVTQFNDLDAGISTAFKHIFQTNNEVEKLGETFGVFGRRGAKDMSKAIQITGGDLDGFTAKAKELGVTLTDDDIRAAKEFSHTYEKVMFQATVAAEKFALAYADDISSAMEDVSHWLSDNKDNWQQWGHDVGDAIRAVIRTAKQLKDALPGDSNGSNGFKRNADGTYSGSPGWGTIFGGVLGTVYDLNRADVEHERSLTASGSISAHLTSPRDPDDVGDGSGKNTAARDAARARKEAEREAKRKAEEQKRELERIEAERVAAARQSFQDETAFFEAEAEKRYAIAAEYADREGKTENDLAKFKEFLDSEVLRVRKEKLEEYIKQLVAGTKEMDRAQQELRILEQQIDTDRANHAKNQQERDKKTLEDEKKIHDERRKHWKEYQDFIHEQMDLEDQERDRRAAEEAAARRKQAESGSVLGGTGIGGGIGRGLGVSLPSIFDDQNQIKTQAQVIKDVYADLADTAGQAIGSMVQGLAQLGAAWLITGEFSGQAALAMIASTALQIATEAGFKAVFEYAEGLAALGTTWGVPNPSSIAHFAAAGVYGTIAAVAGGIGIGAGLGARALGGGKSAAGASGGGSSAGQSNQVNQNPTPYQRVSENAYISGRRDDHLIRTLERVNQTLDRYHPTRPGDVLMAGIAQKPGAIGNAAVNDVKRNSGIGRTLRQVSGSG